MKAFYVFAVLTAMGMPAFAFDPGPISPEQALGRQGHEVTVQGPAQLRHPTANYDGQDAMLVALASGDNKAVVLGYIRNADIDKFPDLHSLDGRVIDISGTLEMDNGQAEIRLETPDQITVER